MLVLGVTFGMGSAYVLAGLADAVTVSPARLPSLQAAV